MEKIKRQIILLIALIISSQLYSQNNSSQIDYSVLLGFSYSKVYDNISGEKFDYRIMFPSIGLRLTWNKFERFPISTELSYTTKGTKYGKGFVNKYRFPYIIHSLNGNYKLRTKGENLLELSIGGYWGYLIKYELDGEVRNEPQIKEIDYGINFGVERIVKVGKIGVIINPRIELGMRTFSFSKHLLLQFRTGVELYN